MKTQFNIGTEKVLFAFDMGTNSLGWCVLGLDSHDEPDRIVDAGVRIFSDGREPKSGNSLAEGRRMARGMSRRRDRYKRRRKATIRTLTEYGLMPADPDARKALVRETNDPKQKDRSNGPLLDIYNLRARALNEMLPLYHIGRALFHLNQRRGFKSNRKTDRKSNEKGAIESGTERLYLAMKASNARTLGEFLAGRRGDDPSNWGQVRVRGGTASGEGEEKKSARIGYDFYPDRKMLQDEFNLIWEAQSAFHPDLLTEERRAHLFLVMFFQRELKPQIPGKCSFNPAENRLPRAHPLFQSFRLYKEVNELELVMPDFSHRKLTPEQRDELILHLRGVRKATYASLRKTLKLSGRSIRFNKETESRKDMAGDEVAAALSAADAFGNNWSGFSTEQQWEVVRMLRDTQDTLTLRIWLMEKRGLSEQAADAAAKASLPEGYGRLGYTALSDMLHELIHGTADDRDGRQVVIVEAEAAKRAGYDHALARAGDGLDELPNYQEVLERRIPPGTGEPSDPYDIRMGRITNPTVHIGLNQLRRVVNGLIRRFGKPERIVLELARDLNQSDDQKREANKRIARNTRDAEMRSAKLLELGQRDNGHNRMLLKLWEELNEANPVDRRCIYSGAVISASMLFSGAVDIDHILPWSRTLDDSQSNRILCTREANRRKGNFAPAEVLQWIGSYDEILERATRLPEPKRWRFARDAMEQFEKKRGFLDRQLTDTQYLARLAHDYLGALYPDEEPDGEGELKRRNHVIVVTGKMTEMLRRNWGLNNILPDHNYGETAKGKNRKDHRHHAIDAAVIGVTTRAKLKQIADAAREGESQGAENAARSINPPWESFRDDLKSVVDRIVVSHKPDRGTLPRAGVKGQTAGGLHNDTAYGITGEVDEKGNSIVVRRKSFLSLTEKDIPSIRDQELRARLYTATSGLTGNSFKAALLTFTRTDKTFSRIRHVRVTEPLSVIPIRNREGRVYKGYKGDANFRYDVWELLDGKWIPEVISMFDAHKSGWTSKVRAEHPTARKVLSLQQNDMVAYEHPITGDTIGIVTQMWQNGQISLVPHREAGDLKKRNALPCSEEEAAALASGTVAGTPPESQEFDPFKFYAPTAGGLKRAKLRQIRIDETGRVFDPGPQDRQARFERKAAARS